MTYKLVFQMTEGKTEYLQDNFSQITNEHSQHHSSYMDFIGGLYLEQGYWVNYYKCESCPQQFLTFGKSGEQEEKGEGEQER